MESRMRGNSHVRFGKRDGGNHWPRDQHGAPVPTSRDPTPSPQDLAVTQRLKDAGKLMGIDVLDHVVMARDGFVILAQHSGS